MEYAARAKPRRRFERALRVQAPTPTLPQRESEIAERQTEKLSDNQSGVALRLPRHSKDEELRSAGCGAPWLPLRSWSALAVSGRYSADGN